MFRIRVAFTGIAGTPGVATHYFGGDATTAGQAGADGAAVLWNAVKPLLHPSLHWAIEPTAVDVDPVTGNATGVTAVVGASGIGGLIGQDLAPTGCQGVLRWHTGEYVGGREIHGHTFVPGLTIQSLLGGSGMNSSHVTTLTAACASFIAAAGSDPVIWSRKHAVGYSILAGSCWNEYGMLRSRRD